MHTLVHSPHPTLWALAATLLCACAAGGGDGPLGGLELGLTTQAAGVSYRLSNARFTLEGPEPREFSAPEEVDRLQFELPQGAYRLVLHEGFTLAQDGEATRPVAARLVSANPAPVTITAGETTRVALRFELAAGDALAPGQGVLQVGVEVSGPDGGVSAGAGCAEGLRIAEVDYEQASADDAEFVELYNAGTCAVSLADVSLEFVNGGDGKVYGRYALADAASTLDVGERLVLADATVLASLPSAVKRAPLNASGLQNGPDGVRIVQGEQVIDAVAYEGDVTGAQEGMPAPADEADLALSRCPDGFDSGDGARDFRTALPTPGSANECS